MGGRTELGSNRRLAGGRTEAEPEEGRPEQFFTQIRPGSTEILRARGAERGYVTYAEINAVLPTDRTSSEQIEDTMTMLSELGISVVDEDAEEPTGTDATYSVVEVRGNLGDEIGRAHV